MKKTDCPKREEESSLLMQNSHMIPAEFDSSYQIIIGPRILLVFTGRTSPDSESQFYKILGDNLIDFEVADTTQLEQSCGGSKSKKTLSPFDALIFISDDKIDAKSLTLASNIKMTTSNSVTKRIKMYVCLKDLKTQAKILYNMQVFDCVTNQESFSRLLRDITNDCKRL